MEDIEFLKDQHFPCKRGGSSFSNVTENTFILIGIFLHTLIIIIVIL
jgi:hypothetical protein